jgi:hypothetical protein
MRWHVMTECDCGVSLPGCNFWCYRRVVFDREWFSESACGLAGSHHARRRCRSPKAEAHVHGLAVAERNTSSPPPVASYHVAKSGNPARPKVCSVPGTRNTPVRRTPHKGFGLCPQIAQITLSLDLRTAVLTSTIFERIHPAARLPAQT